MEIINLNKICGGCASVGLGSKLDTLEKDLEEGNTYSGELLTDEEVNTLNNICPVLSQLSLGTYINNILTASKEGTEVENLTEEQIDMLNHQTCGGFETMEVGSKISDFVEEINEGGGGTTVLRLDIKDKAGELVPEDIIVTNNDEFISAFNAVKVGKTVDVSIGGEIGGIVVPESERITMKLTKTSETEGNFRHELVPYNYASLYISGGYCNLVTYYYEVHSPNKIKFNDIFSDANIFDYIDYISNQSHSGFFYLCGLNITSDAGDDLIGFMAPESGVHNKCDFYLDEPFENQLVVGLEMQESSSMDFKLVNNNVSSEAEFLTYNFTVGSDEYFEGVIDQENGTITVDVPSGTVLTAIAPTFTLSTGAIAKVGNVVQESGVTTNDFTNSVIYVITAEDGKTTKSYTVSIIPDNTIAWTEDTISHIMVFDKNVTTTIDPDTIEDTTGDAVCMCGEVSAGLITYNFKTDRDDYMVNFSVFSDNSEHPEIINATYTSDDGFHWTLIEGEYVAGYEEDPPFGPIIVPFTADRTEVDTHNKYSIVENNSYADAYPLLLEFVRTTPGGLE